MLMHKLCGVALLVVATGTAQTSSYVALPAGCRAVDTRSGFGFAGAFGPPRLVPNKPRVFVLRDVCGIPASATAYALSITAITSGPLQYLQAFADDSARAGPSIIAGLTAAGSVNASAIVAAGADGGIRIIATSAADLLVDVTGYFVPLSALLFPVSHQTSGYIVQPADNNSVLRIDAPTAVNVVLNPGLPVGFGLVLVQEGAGRIVITGVTPVRVNVRAGYSATTYGQWSTMSLLATSQDAYVASGDLTPQ